MISPQRRKVALLIAQRVGERDVPAARELLEVLGLVAGPGARELSDDPPGLPVSTRGRVGHDVVLAELTGRTSTTPPGLAQLGPVAAPAESRSTATRRPAAKPARAQVRPAGPSTEVTQTGRRARAVCGTRGGYERHLRNGEVTCQPCRDAQSAHVRARYAAKKAAGGATARPGRPATAVCGTVSGYGRHKRAGQKPCDACHQALLAYHRDRRAKRAAS